MWQDDYWAVSIGESQVKSIRDYIFNQEKHHTENTFTNEVNDFMEKYKLEVRKY